MRNDTVDTPQNRRHTIQDEIKDEEVAFTRTKERRPDEPVGVIPQDLDHAEEQRCGPDATERERDTFDSEAVEEFVQNNRAARTRLRICIKMLQVQRSGEVYIPEAILIQCDSYDIRCIGFGKPGTRVELVNPNNQETIVMTPCTLKMVGRNQAQLERVLPLGEVRLAAARNQILSGCNSFKDVMGFACATEGPGDASLMNSFASLKQVEGDWYKAHRYLYY